jgi:hypothetical protein
VLKETIREYKYKSVRLQLYVEGEKQQVCEKIMFQIIAKSLV